MFKVTTKIIAIVPFALQYILTKSSRKYSLKYDEIGLGTRVYPWRIHADVWQNQYNIVK